MVRSFLAKRDSTNCALFWNMVFRGRSAEMFLDARAGDYSARVKFSAREKFSVTRSKHASINDAQVFRKEDFSSAVASIKVFRRADFFY
jgi:hypothetical protein